MYRKLNGEPGADFRAKATLGVAWTAIILLLPVGIYDLIISDTAVGIAALSIVFVLAANAWIVLQGQCHQKLTLFGLIPAGMVFMIGLFDKDPIIASFWSFPTLVSCYCMLSERKAWLANIIILLFAIPLAWKHLEFAYALRVTIAMFATSVFAAIMVRVIDQQRQMLQEQLVLDPLTSVLNRLTFNSCMERVVQAHTHDKIPVCLLAMDIDHFKRLNDSQGHAAGDRVLKEVGQILRTTLNDNVSIFRMGGEEFTIILNDTTILSAARTAEGLRQNIANYPFQDHSTVTVSIGVSEHRLGETWESWGKRADDRLYAAKRKGRNKVVASTKAQERANIQLVNLV